ncbi:MAG TPA: hypothetical protein V6C64_11975, partial [Microcoleaceae cyanobacterium]
QKLPRKLLIAQSAVDEEVNLKFESRGCRKTKTTQVTCDVLVTDLANQRQGIRFSVSNSAIPNTNAIDSSGTVHPVQRTESGASFSDLVVSDGSACRCFTVSLASGIPTKVTFIFEIPQDVTELAALDIGYWWYKDSSSLGVSHRTAVSNIGTIASQSNPIRQRPKQN